MEGGRIYRKLKIWNDGLYFFSTEQEKEAAGSIFSSFFFLPSFTFLKGICWPTFSFFFLNKKKCPDLIANPFLDIRDRAFDRFFFVHNFFKSNFSLVSLLSFLFFAFFF